MLQVLSASGRPQRTLRAPLKMKDNLPESQVEILCEASREGKQKCRHGKRKYGFVFCSLLGFRNIADFIGCLCLLPDALFVLSWWLSLFRSFFCFCESLDLCCAGVVTPRRMQHTKTKSTAVRADRTSDNKRASLPRRFQNFPFALFLLPCTFSVAL